MPRLGWPDWSRTTAVVVASGPSAKDAPLWRVKRSAKVLVVKESWRLAPWAAALYGSDGVWWERNAGVPEFKGLKLSASPRAVTLYPDVRLVQLRRSAELQTDDIGTVGTGARSGGHSGFHALNLAVQFGAKRIVLVGFDLNRDEGSHWHGDHPGHVNPDARLLEEWHGALDGCAPQFAAMGVTVVNASPGSALQNYSKVDPWQSERASNRSTETSS